MSYKSMVLGDGSSNFDLETTREMIILRDSCSVQVDQVNVEEIKKEYKDRLRQIPIISRLVRK